MQQQTCKMVWPFSFIILFSFCFLSLNFKESPGGKSVEKCGKRVPKRLCPLVVAFSFSLTHAPTRACREKDWQSCGYL